VKANLRTENPCSSEHANCRIRGAVARYPDLQGNAGKVRLRTKFFCDVTPYLWVNCYRCFEGSYCLHLQGKSGLYSWTARTLQIKALRSLETSEILAQRHGVTCRRTVLAIPLRDPRKSRGEAATNQATAPNFIAQFDSFHSALLIMFQNNNI